MVTPDSARVRPIAATETYPVRLAILRPGYPPESAIFPGDEAASSLHFGAFEPTGTLAGVASLYRTPFPDEDLEDALGFQLRGMATVESVRGQGFGGALLEACVAAASRAGADLLWCNARTKATGFYARHGWQIHGSEFDIAYVGPHFRMLFHLPRPASQP